VQAFADSCVALRSLWRHFQRLFCIKLRRPSLESRWWPAVESERVGLGKSTPIAYSEVAGSAGRVSAHGLPRHDLKSSLGRVGAAKSLIPLARQERFELQTPRFVVWCCQSVQEKAAARSMA
jgi:hypothetical protein